MVELGLRLKNDASVPFSGVSGPSLKKNIPPKFQHSGAHVNGKDPPPPIERPP